MFSDQATKKGGGRNMVRGTTDVYFQRLYISAEYEYPSRPALGTRVWQVSGENPTKGIISSI